MSPKRQTFCPRCGALKRDDATTCSRVCYWAGITAALAQRSCSEPDCDGRIEAKGLCDKHYQRFSKYGTTKAAAPWVDQTLEARFWSKVAKADNAACWLWMSQRDSHGYGMFSTYQSGQRIRIKAHRYSVSLDGRDPAGLVVMHTCDNPPCVNPAHLKVGTQAENMRDALEKGRMDTSGLAIGQAMTAADRKNRDGLTGQQRRRMKGLTA